MGKHAKPEEIVAELRQFQVLTAQGKPIAEAARSIGVSEQAYYHWRAAFGSMTSDQVKRLKALELENMRFRRVVSDLTLDKLILTEAARGAEGLRSFCESFNSNLRDELLKLQVFYTLRNPEVLIERWRRHFNTMRPHSSYGYVPPVPEAILPRREKVALWRMRQLWKARPRPTPTWRPHPRCTNIPTRSSRGGRPVSRGQRVST